MVTFGATLKVERKSINTAISAGGSTSTTSATIASSRANGEPSPPTSPQWFDEYGDNDDDDDVVPTLRVISGPLSARVMKDSNEGMTSTV